MVLVALAMATIPGEPGIERDSLYARQAAAEPALDDRRPGRTYTLTLRAGDAIVQFEGFIDFGATREMRELLTENPQISVIVINSGGGPVYEARGLARLFTEKGVETYSDTGCSSACVTAFMGGTRRWLGPDARMGFHRYRIRSRYPWPRIDPDEELRKDLEFYESRDVNTSFLARVFDVPHDQIWYPPPGDLVRSGVINGVTPSPLHNSYR